jgi:hypothetical protein
MPPALGNAAQGRVPARAGIRAEAWQRIDGRQLPAAVGRGGLQQGAVAP